MDSTWYSLKDLKLLGVTPTSNETNSRNGKATLITDIFELLKSGDSEIKLYDNYKNIICIFGETGNGKSNFTHWITGDNTKLISREIENDTGEFIIEDINNIGRSTITSDTLYPQLLVDDERNVAFCDNPGFNDTRKENIVIAITYFIKKVMNHADRVKLIFVINYHSVRKGVDRHNFMKLVKQIADFIKNIEKFRNSIALIVTKVDNLYEKQGTEFKLVSDVKIITAVANFLAEVKQELEEKLQDSSLEERRQFEVGIKFISILLDKDGDQFSRIGIFRRPDKPGPLSEIILLQEEKKIVKRLIHENLVFSTKEHNDFGYTTSEKCKNKIHYLVEDINTSVWASLCHVKEEIKEHYTKTVDLIQNTMRSVLDETSASINLEEARELLFHLRDGCRRIFHLVEDARNVKSPEDLAQKLNTIISNLDIKISEHHLTNIENKGKYFNILQIVSDRQLSVKPWHEKIIELYAYMSNARVKLQEEIGVIAPKICKRMEFDFQTIAKTMQDQIDENTKLLDIKETVEALNHYRIAMFKMTEETKSILSVTELLKLACDVSRDININLPEHHVLNALQHVKNFMFLKAISEKEVNFVLSTCKHPFESLVKYLKESIIWCRFLDMLYLALTQYEIQLNKQKFNVVDIEDWGKTDKPQGIVVTENNFKQFLRNVADCNIAVHDDIQNITLTDLRLEELNQLLIEALKHRIKIQHAQSSVFIRADYISMKEIISILQTISGNGHDLFDDFNPGVFKFLHIFALKKVFIDEDLSLPGGVELIIISPKWEIIGTRTISLDGTEGEAHSEIKAEDGIIFGSNGGSGEPGLPGKPGGIFLGIGESFLHEANLTVTVNGGNGGPGQNGGNGQDGIQGDGVGYLSNDDLPSLDAEGITRIKGFPCEKINCGSESSMLEQAVRFIGSVFPQNPLVNILTSHFAGNTLYKIVGSPGQAGGNGGEGGKGGRGGNPGKALIINFKKIVKIITFANKGKDGMDGIGGNAGKDGQNGNIKFAVLRNESQPMNGLQIPIPGLAVPFPGQQGPIPGLPVPILGLPLPTVQRRPEWIHQIDVPGGTVSTGFRGTCGLNSVGLKVPESLNAATEPFKVVRDYEMYARQNLNSRFKKDALLNFIALLNDDEIKPLLECFT